MKKNAFILLLVALFIGIYACEETPKEPQEPTDPTPTEPTFTQDDITPANFPDLGLPNFNFPEDSNVLNGWIQNSNDTEIYTHVWGIWKGLTQETGQNVGQQPLRVYETWLTPDMMKDAMRGEPIVRSNRVNVRKPKQHTHFGPVINSNIVESVAYSPAAADYAITNKLMLAPELYMRYYKQQQEGATDQEPNFPNDAITIKPVFKILKAGADLQAIEVWPGSPTEFLPNGFPEQDWGAYVYVDVTNQRGQNTGQYDTVPSGTTTPSAPTPQVTYNLNDFIHYTLTEEDAHYFNLEFGGNLPENDKAAAGDHAILVGMHVTTKENTRWTWQSYWWAPDPANPGTPSSPEIAIARANVGLTGAPNHYAAAVGYYMVDPKEPYASSTTVQGEPNYAFNPYLEAGFPVGTFEPDTSLSFVEQPDGNKIPTYIGIRTTCMSCHGMATAKFENNNFTTLQYVGNNYLSLTDPMFEGFLKADFAWSIPGELDTTGLAAAMKANPITK
jgi:hypothetical protein